MKDSRRRLVTIALVYGLGVLVVGAHTGYTMLVQHRVWERRSYDNRWAFRDVPTKRGAIRDRTGELLRADAPATSLEILYRTFRRADPAGISVHFGNLLLTAAGQGPRYTFQPGDPAAAFELCLGVTLDFLRADRSVGQDLRFYAAALLAALTDGDRSEVYQRLTGLLRSERRGALVAAMGLRPAELQKAFAAHQAALARIGAVLAESGVDLFAELRQCEERRSKKTVTEYVHRTLVTDLSYQQAQRIVMDQEWHPGFRVRASVTREDEALTARWESLRRLLGRVKRDWSGEDADARRREAILEAMKPELQRMAESGDDLPDELQEAVTRRLEATMRVHLANHGRVGADGCELAADPTLRGRAGMSWVERRRQAEVGLWSAFDVDPGDDVYLTVDLRLQHLLEQAVDDALTGLPRTQDAAAAIVDPLTGDILAVVSRPDREFDTVGKAGLGNAVRWTGDGTVGSLAKPLLLAEYLDAKRRGRPFRDHTGFTPCRGAQELPKDPAIPFFRLRLRCDHVHGDSVHDCRVSLGVSCNAFFYQVGEGLGWAGVRRAYERFGLFRPKAVDGQPPPALPPAFQPRVRGIPASAYPDPKWGSSNDIQRRAIGYYVAANVLQIARAYCGLATGRLPELSLVLRPPSELRFVELGLHPDDLALVRDGMRYCVERGTARDLGLTGVWAKTGTAEVGRKVRGRANNNAWLAGFVGLAPARLVFACVVYDVEHGGYGAKVAGPMFAKFLAALRADPALQKDYL